ncbi:MAG: sugar phosphate isomerase/epimerase [Blautia sp.]|nr:sugar phosphate isomerase/epimerase [Blautia sp.]
MRIGLSSPLSHETPEEWAAQMSRLGCRSIVFPADYTQPDHIISDYVDAAKKYDLLIAEVGIWKNVFARDPAECEEARQRALGQLRLADEIGAKCCVNVAGTKGGPIWDGGYAINFTRESWDDIVAYTRDLLDTVRPRRTEYSVEPMPWMYPTGPDECLKLLQDVDRPGFGIHLDIVNMVNCPQRYFFLDDFLDECFEKLDGKICSCHLKDIRLTQELTFQLEETFCGNGILNIEKYMKLIHQQDPEMPVIIEHLTTDEEYRMSLAYVQKLLEKAGIPF